MSDTRSKQALKWWEYAGSKLPIPAASAIDAVGESLNEQGVSTEKSNALINGSLGLWSGIFGVHIHEDSAPTKP